jgi:hypothetical protein
MIVGRNKKLAESLRVINHDVYRTDRVHPAFRRDDGDGLLMLKSLLHAYCVFNPAIGYLQGMSDLCVPIILGYFPKWDAETGKPLNEEELCSEIPMIFLEHRGDASQDESHRFIIVREGTVSRKKSDGAADIGKSCTNH